MIDSFEGEYRFLSNFHDSIVDVNHRMFASAEHAYQACKTRDPVWQEDIRLARSPAMAKRLGRACPLRDDWHIVKVNVMSHILRCKFAHGSALAEKLLATDDQMLVEGNTWNDTFWGAIWKPLWLKTHERVWAERPVPGTNNVATDVLQGQNHLGRLLMERREVLRGD